VQKETLLVKTELHNYEWNMCIHKIKPLKTFELLILSFCLIGDRFCGNPKSFSPRDQIYSDVPAFINKTTKNKPDIMKDWSNSHVQYWELLQAT